ncbi:uncharacterized protein LOC108041272 isoform X2 [Drosophila rhopaloa]|uniref:DH domain-containing protein n=1 Tax=Drosophila rhopaloa TaxID=1041015 RepID=A0ABM5J7G9_DRORH|nr:uncharacterized protein LOC108041272 isoform X2 [Drosophila rhopaloa]
MPEARQGCITYDMPSRGNYEGLPMKAFYVNTENEHSWKRENSDLRRISKSPQPIEVDQSVRRRIKSRRFIPCCCMRHSTRTVDSEAIQLEGEAIIGERQVPSHLPPLKLSSSLPTTPQLGQRVVRGRGYKKLSWNEEQPRRQLGESSMIAQGQEARANPPLTYQHLTHSNNNNNNNNDEEYDPIAKYFANTQHQKLSPRIAAKSSRILCENCCGERQQQVGSSMDRQKQQQQQEQQQQQQHHQQHQQQQLPFGDYDSVSDLSSFRFVFNGEEVDSTRRVLVDAHYEDAADDDDDVARPPVIEIEKRQPNTSTTKTEKSTEAVAATTAVGVASSPVLSLSSEISDESPAICCYTIDKKLSQQQHLQQQSQQAQQQLLIQQPKQQQQQPNLHQQQHLQHYNSCATVSYRSYRHPPPVPPKPRACVESSVSDEPALKTRRLVCQHQQHQPRANPSHYPNRIYPANNCCIPKDYHPYAFEGNFNNNINYNCRFGSSGDCPWGLGLLREPRSLCYDRHGRLTFDSEPEVGVEKSNGVHKSLSESRLQVQYHEEPKVSYDPYTDLSRVTANVINQERSDRESSFSLPLQHNRGCHALVQVNPKNQTNHLTQVKRNNILLPCHCDFHVDAPFEVDKENGHTMEKRRNTLDRFQRLGFGRKSSPAAAASTSTSSSPTTSGPEKQRKTSDRSERLRELTELLRGGGGGSSSRASSTPTPPPPPPPPVPPPRKPRNSNLERQDTGASQTSESEAGSIHLRSPVEDTTRHSGGGGGTISTAARLFASLRPNTSLSNLEAFMLSNREKSKSPPPPAQQNLRPAGSRCVDASATGSASFESTALASRSDSRSAHKSAPFRSVSFSQIDCKSTLSALRDRLKRDKAIEVPCPSPTPSKEEDPHPDPGWVRIPLKKTELSINLNYGQEKSLDHDAIQEEDIFSNELAASGSSGILFPVATASSVIAAHATMESLTDTIQSESDCLIKEEVQPQIPPVLEITPPTSSVSGSAPNLATLMEEQLPLEAPPDNFLQTATTCEIPVPVYECAAQEWLETPAQEWVEVAPEEFGIVPETIQPPIPHAACKISQTPSTLTTAVRSDLVPTISVSRSSEEGDELAKIEDVPQVEVATTAKNPPMGQHCKQYSHDDLDLANVDLRSSLEAIATPRHSTDERQRRHLDKSTKRKGMYIDNADWQAPTEAPNRGLALDISVANLNAIKPESPDATTSGASQMYISSPQSSYSFELNTPELEKGSPSWGSGGLGRDKAQLLSNFSCHSSEEKDDASTRSLSFLRTDSTSDNECDRAARERERERITSSPTPSSGDYDYKRFSKRPLRGPYGQMLEAEMKKPNRMHFEEILEELRETDSLHLRGSAPGGAAGGSGGPSRNLPQYSNSMRVRKSSTYLPVPSHARAASTPSQLEHGSKGISAATAQISVSAKNLSEAELDDQVHHMKRAASEAPAPKSHHSKRSQSISTERPIHHHHGHSHGHGHSHSHHHSAKRSLDAGSGDKASKAAAPSAGSPGSGGGAKAGLKPTPALLAELLKGSSENMISEQRKKTIADTRTYVVQEIYRNEQSYVESLQTVVVKYLKVLKAPEHAGMIDTRTVDEIFFMVPDILEIHEKFLGDLKNRLDDWDVQQKVGDAFMDTFSKLEVLEVYTSFVNNCNRAKNAIRSMKHQRPSFSKFLESTAREHKGKLTLDNLLIKPVQKFPNYELLFQRLIKHTDHDHPDTKHLQDVLKLVHDILVHINCKEREIMENGQREATLRELEGVIEGITDLIAPERQFLLFDLVSMPSGQGARKDRGFFLFNDLLVLTSIKKRSGTIRKPNSSICPGTVATTLDTNKYKFLTKISLDCLEIVKSKDENIKRIVSEIETLADDCAKLQQITDITTSLKYPHQYLEDVIRDLQREVQRQLSERQTNDTQLNMLELTVSSPNGNQKLTVVFNKTEKRTQWEESFNEAKQKLAATLERHPIPEFLTSIPIRKTRAGLQFTCAAATLSDNRDVWVCNSDGYVGQVCIMSLHPEPNVTSCNGVCNARILCVASVPAYSSAASSRNSSGEQPAGAGGQDEKDKRNTPQSYTQQLRDYRKSISPSFQSASTSATATPEKKKLTPTPTPVASGEPAVAAATGSSDTQLELNLSSSDDETEAAAASLNVVGSTGAGSGATLAERIPSPAPSYHGHQDSNPEEGESNQSTMWIGTEDGCIHVYNSTDNIRIKKNRIKIEHHSAVYSILYLDNRVFVSLANGDICVYLRDGATSWNTCSSHCLSIGTVTSPVNKLLNVNGRLWCSIQGIIKVLDVETLTVINQIQISSDSKPITNMTVSNNHVWISIQNSAHIKCFHSNTHQLVTEVNLAPAVNKMLSNCDEIIRQHKAACLRVTSLLCCKDLIWIGTSAGVLLTIPAQGYEKGAINIVPTGIPHGHTGHVRFLTFVETTGLEGTAPNAGGRDAGGSTSDEYSKQGSIKHSKSKSETNNTLIISGGDGYEDFRNSGANSLSEIAGREDSTNHLLIWQI